MRRLFDFECDKGHVFEAFVESDTRETQCTECGSSAHRLVSAPSFKLEGCSGAFPGAYYKWETDRKKQIEHERKRNG